MLPPGVILVFCLLFVIVSELADLKETQGAHGHGQSLNLQQQNPDLDDDDDEDGKSSSKRERRKIEIKFIQEKSRRHITFSKRKAGIMKKAYELSVLTGTQVLLLVVSETGLVYTFTTPKLQPLVTKAEGKNLIQACLNAPEEPSNEEEELQQESAPAPQQQQQQSQAPPQPQAQIPGPPQNQQAPPQYSVPPAMGGSYMNPEQSPYYNMGGYAGGQGYN